MNPSKAIKILTPLTIPPGTCPDPDINNAIKLGIEALKRIVYLRKDMDCPHWMTLPGETEE